MRLYNRALTQAEIQTDMITPLAQQSLPPAPVCLAPSNGGSGQPTSLPFDWNRVAVASGYHIQVSSDSLFASPVINDAQLTDTVRQVTNLAQATKYFWRVSSRSSGGEGAYSAVWSFRTLTAGLPPAPPVLATPANGAIGVAPNPTLMWRASTGATSYRVQVSTGANFTTTVIDQSNIALTSFAASGLLPNTTYYWHVSATDSAGTSAYSGSWSFTTAVPTPPQPVLASPANGATGVSTNPTLTWSASTGAISYRLQVSTDANFGTTVVDQGNISTTSYSATGLAVNRQYFWHVNATSSGGTSTFSAAWSFTTGSVPTGLAAAYAFDEGTGTTVADASNHGLTGTISGATWTTQGKYTNALSFNGTSGYVDLGNPASLQMTGSMTLSAWVKATANPPDDGQIIAKSDNVSGWQLKTSPDTGPHTFGIAISDGSTHVQRYSSTVRALNVWYHIAGVYNAKPHTLDIYVNGVLNNGVLKGVIPASQSNANVNVNIGRRTGGYYFKGIIDEVRLYNRALTQLEIQSDMNTPLTGQSRPSAPVGIELTGTTGVTNATAADYDPDKYTLDQNYPNPFNPSTIVSFNIPQQGYVTLAVYNLLGQKVATLVDGVLDAGRKQVRFSGDHLANGVYFYVLKAGSFSETRRMMLLK